jgi:hypothetical protein
MASGGVVVRCPSCSRSWEVPRRADGSLPATARCAIGRGGCGRTGVRVPRAALPASRPGGAAGWDPPSQPRAARDAGQPCPQCGGPVKVEPRGITRWCPACPLMVTPPGVLAPYERGTGAAREARSQRERDDDAKKTVILAGEFLRQVEALAADPQIHPASADLLGWYAEEITKARAARDARRLAELAAEFDQDRRDGSFRRRHWWQGQPAALAAAADPGDDEDGDDDYDDGQGDDGQGVMALAAPPGAAGEQLCAQPRRATWAEALAELGWAVMPAPEWDGCQVASAGGQPCRDPQTPHSIGAGWACSAHYGAVEATLGAINQARGIS